MSENDETCQPLFPKVYSDILKILATNHCCFKSQWHHFPQKMYLLLKIRFQNDIREEMSRQVLEKKEEGRECLSSRCIVGNVGTSDLGG